MKAIEWMAAMLWGASIGAAAALLCTPYDGKHMRRLVCRLLKKSGAPCCCAASDCAADVMESDDAVFLDESKSE